MPLIGFQQNSTLPLNILASTMHGSLYNGLMHVNEPRSFLKKTCWCSVNAVTSDGYH
jgi:hypothetical protein